MLVFAYNQSMNLTPPKCILSACARFNRPIEFVKSCDAYSRTAVLRTLKFISIWICEVIHSYTNSDTT